MACFRLWLCVGVKFQTCIHFEERFKNVLPEGALTRLKDGILSLEDMLHCHPVAFLSLLLMWRWHQRRVGQPSVQSESHPWLFLFVRMTSWRQGRWKLVQEKHVPSLPDCFVLFFLLQWLEDMVTPVKTLKSTQEAKKKSQSPNRSGICDLEGKEQQTRHAWLDYLVRVIKGCFKALPRPAFSLLWSRLETSGSPHKSSRGAGQLGGKVLHLKYCYSSLMLLPQDCFIYCSCWLNKKTHCSKVIFGTGAS